MNFGLPETTRFDRRVPKQKFYENLAVSAALKRSFIDEMQTVWWRNKLAPATLNLAPGTAVSEIEVFEIELRGSRLDENVLRQMDREIPYHLLFVLSFENRVQAWIGYKESATTGNKAFKVERYYHTEWMPRESLCFELNGHTLDAVYENLVRQIGGSELKASSDEDLKASVARDAERKRIEAEIVKLEKRARVERQPKRKFELVQHIRQLEGML